MYISEISGHHSATLAVEKALKMLAPGIEIMNINAFNYTNPISEKIINRLYMAVIKRTPQIWDYLYDNPKVAKNLSGIKEAVHKFNSPKLKNLFDKFKPEAVLCTQAFPCGMVADFKKQYNSNLPLVAVLTDYIPHSYWIYDKVDYYITPSEEVTQRLADKGAVREKIKSLGIPIDPKFKEALPRAEAMKRLGLDPNVFTVLIMGGGQGLGPIKTITKSLERVTAEIQEIIVTGSNKKLYRSMSRRIKKYKKKILLFGYAKNIDELMDAADVVVTKPGGITTAEALAKKLPIIIVRPIPGQETSNTSYFTAKRVAIKLDRAEDINLLIEDFIHKPEKLRQISSVAAGISKPNSSLDIARLLLDLCDRKENV